MDETHKEPSKMKIKVVGIGNSGKNTINRMIENDVKGIDFVFIDTDLQTLSLSNASKKLQTSHQLIKGLDTNSDYSVGFESEEENVSNIKNILGSSDLVFITTGLGGITGTALSLMVAKEAHKLGCLTIGVVTKPFFFEGKERLSRAQSGIEKLETTVDTLIAMSDEKFLSITARLKAMLGAYKDVDNLLSRIIVGIVETFKIQSKAGLDFTDIGHILKDKGAASIGVGIGKGNERAIDAASKAVKSPLHERDLNKATEAFVFITSDNEVSEEEVGNVISEIKACTNKEIVLIPNTSINTKVHDELIVIIVALGLKES